MVIYNLYYKFMRIFVGVLWQWNLNQQSCGQNRIFFSNFGRQFSGPLEFKPMLLCSVMNYFIGFPVTLKCLTLNDREMPFYAKICFLTSDLTTFLCLEFGDNNVKTNEDTHILSETNMTI